MLPRIDHPQALEYGEIEQLEHLSENLGFARNTLNSKNPHVDDHLITRFVMSLAAVMNHRRSPVPGDLKMRMVQLLPVIEAMIITHNADRDLGLLYKTPQVVYKIAALVLNFCELRDLEGCQFTLKVVETTLSLQGRMYFQEIVGPAIENFYKDPLKYSREYIACSKFFNRRFISIGREELRYQYLFSSYLFSLGTVFDCRNRGDLKELYLYKMSVKRSVSLIERYLFIHKVSGQKESPGAIVVPGVGGDPGRYVPYRLSCLGLIVQLGELSANFPERLMSEAEKIFWKALKKLGNELIHPRNQLKLEELYLNPIYQLDFSKILRALCFWRVYLQAALQWFLYDKFPDPQILSSWRKFLSYRDVENNADFRVWPEKEDVIAFTARHADLQQETFERTLGLPIVQKWLALLKNTSKSKTPKEEIEEVIFGLRFRFSRLFKILFPLPINLGEYALGKSSDYRIEGSVAFIMILLRERIKKVRGEIESHLLGSSNLSFTRNALRTSLMASNIVDSSSAYRHHVDLEREVYFPEKKMGVLKQLFETVGLIFGSFGSSEKANEGVNFQSSVDFTMFCLRVPDRVPQNIVQAHVAALLKVPTKLFVEVAAEKKLWEMFVHEVWYEFVSGAVPPEALDKKHPIGELLVDNLEGFGNIINRLEYAKLYLMEKMNLEIFEETLAVDDERLLGEAKTALGNEDPHVIDFEKWMAIRQNGSNELLGIFRSNVFRKRYLAWLKRPSEHVTICPAPWRQVLQKGDRRVGTLEVLARIKKSNLEIKTVNGESIYKTDNPHAKETLKIIEYLGFFYGLES